MDNRATVISMSDWQQEAESALRAGLMGGRLERKYTDVMKENEQLRNEIRCIRKALNYYRNKPLARSESKESFWKGICIGIYLTSLFLIIIQILA